jgi:hypothetical protein
MVGGDAALAMAGGVAAHHGLRVRWDPDCESRGATTLDSGREGPVRPQAAADEGMAKTPGHGVLSHGELTRLARY